MAKKGAAKSAAKTAAKIKVKLVKSTIGFNKNQAKVVESLGLRRINHAIEVADTPAMRGMIHKVRHLVEIQ